MNAVYLKAIDHCDPDYFLTSDEIETDLKDVYENLKLPFGRIEMQTGIQSRGIYQDKLPSDIAIQAAQNLLNNTNIDTDDIDLLIFASVCRDFLEPSTASVVHNHLGLREDCQSFDLSNACLGVLSAIDLAKNLLQTDNYRNIMIVTGENATPLIKNTINTLKQDSTLTRKNIKKYFANFTIGSAGVALVISNEPGIAKITSSSQLSDTNAHKLCQGSGDMSGLVMETESEELKERGVALAYENWKQFVKKNNEVVWGHFICHQVGIHHQEYLYQRLELDKNKDFSSFPKYGNTGSAALPLTLSLAMNCKKLKMNDEIALLGIGSGLHTNMMRLTWL